jgi:hypothetical protein
MKCLRVYMNLVRLLNEDNFLFKLISSLNFPTKPDPDRKQICLFTYAVSPMTPQTATTLPKAQLSRNHPNPKASPNSYRSPKHTPPPMNLFVSPPFAQPHQSSFSCRPANRHYRPPQ